ncbi:hypothetical protein CEUSTIGMA_g8174.t1 [Chlamydomonas eustigma]|uniref:Phosphoinositide phospholipase C n=1 Tax=Chlamydomonas eustigma TaxID=1157962 RepID=A0A250XCX4_9CHLO|nr:hypothetical protein CEUSTIGMA_g8174.t1 [Chlamydomonas eustigma]|eukprot:GAX80739.1 hypothetical protein CEUSTIGMA_g8174.t1 [Chlamydomonas eustigma]
MPIMRSTLSTISETVSQLGNREPYSEITDAYPSQNHVYQDMTQPLSHYFISSGHNSYLTSDQVMGPGGTITIIQSLKGACRVIELDCYNGGLEGPICKHGGTATKPVLFRDCVAAIKEYGFVASPYPVIITLENHTDAENQVPLVKILKEQLGEQLFIPAPGMMEPRSWLSPLDLRGKFVIRSKLKNATDQLREIVYIPIKKFTGFFEMNSLDHATSSSMGEAKLEAILKEVGNAAATSGRGEDVSVHDAQRIMTSEPEASAVQLSEGCTSQVVNRAATADLSLLSSSPPAALADHAAAALNEFPAISNEDLKPLIPEGRASLPAPSLVAGQSLLSQGHPAATSRIGDEALMHHDKPVALPQLHQEGSQHPKPVALPQLHQEGSQHPKPAASPQLHQEGSQHPKDAVQGCPDEASMPNLGVVSDRQAAEGGSPLTCCVSQHTQAEADCVSQQEVPCTTAGGSAVIALALKADNLLSQVNKMSGGAESIAPLGEEGIKDSKDLKEECGEECGEADQPEGTALRCNMEDLHNKCINDSAQSGGGTPEARPATPRHVHHQHTDNRSDAFQGSEVKCHTTTLVSAVGHEDKPGLLPSRLCVYIKDGTIVDHPATSAHAADTATSPATFESENLAGQSPSTLHTFNQGTPPRSGEVAQQGVTTSKVSDDLGKAHVNSEPSASELTSVKRFSFAGSAARISLGRSKVTSVNFTTWREVYKYNSHHLLRVYPAAWKVDSRNYNPCVAWNLGASCVALNWQRWDKAMWINEGKFMDNGGCGYVKKPSWMLEANEGLPPPPQTPRRLRVNLLAVCNHHEPTWVLRNFCAAPQDDVLIKVWIKGMPVDSRKQQTKPTRKNGKLVLEDIMFEFPVCFPEMAVLMFIVKRESEHLGHGYFSLPVSNLQPGMYKLNLNGVDRGKPLAHSWLKVGLQWVNHNETQNAALNK